METFTRDEILSRLLTVYDAVYADYTLWELSVGELSRMDFSEESKAARRMVSLVSCKLDGIKKAAEALGFPEQEFLAAVSSPER